MDQGGPWFKKGHAMYVSKIKVKECLMRCWSGYCEFERIWSRKKIRVLIFVFHNMASTQPVVLKLYRSLLKEGRKWHAYNFREYILRTTRESFRRFKDETDSQKINALISKGQEDLEIVKRQGIIQNAYTRDKLVLEIKK